MPNVEALQGLSVIEKGVVDERGRKRQKTRTIRWRKRGDEVSLTGDLSPGD